MITGLLRDSDAPDVVAELFALPPHADVGAVQQYLAVYVNAAAAKAATKSKEVSKIEEWRTFHPY